jgi:hypothetical protein
MRNSDPTGRQGAPSSLDLSSADPAHDLAIIYQGGGKFLDRMRALDDARCASEEAYRRLQIGIDAKEAYEDSKVARDKALALRGEAEKTLDDAKAEAAKIIAEAEAVKAAADKTNADADELRQRHERQLEDVQARERKARAAAEDARQAIAKADAKEREFQAKIDRLQEALRVVLAGI